MNPPFPKDETVIESLIEMVTSEHDVVLDFFAGSATTAHAVMALNARDGGARSFIQVQLPEPTPDRSPAREAGFDTISDLARTRIERAGEKVAADFKAELEARSEPLDIGFRSYELTDTNFSKWRVASDVEPDKLEQHLLSLRDSAEDDATADALLTELLLKQGYSLSEASTELTVAGLPLQSVGAGLLLAYLDEHTKPTLDQLRAGVDEEPARLVILEDAFQGDDELKTNLAQLCKSKDVELWTA